MKTRRWVLGAAVLVVLLLPAGVRARPNTLTPKEVAEGWVLLFDGKTTRGWTSPNGSKWTVFNGMLAPQAGKMGLLVTTAAFADYHLSIEFRQTSQRDFWLLPLCDSQGMPLRPKLNDLQGLSERAGGWWRVEVEVLGGYVIGKKIQAVGGGAGSAWKVPIDRTRPLRGHIALAGNGFIVRNIKLRPLNAKPLFNGKDLTGWKKYEADQKRAKSTFSVTREGWLSLKIGPGDLQTEGQWDDFVLQLDCRTNGKYLNSGVFFRCLPGQYQMGYEAQIHNQFLDPPGKEYTLDVYDPQTHKLKAKKKERFLAADYGTGAIYRRMPARLQMSKDNEWFTMTVVAHGRHLATWVNGVQVVDWTDNRPLADNARQGCYLKKGPISLQGHDPTTDLSFRNLRIAELPPPMAKK